VLRDRAMIYLMYGTGIRVSDLIQLDIDDIDLDNGIVLLKKRNNRSISIPEEILTYIKKYVAYSRPFMIDVNNEQALFVNFRGNRITRQGFWKIIKQYTEQSNIRKRITPHTLRHSFAAHLINNGIEIKELQNKLGHSDISTTQFYATLSNKK
jgi:integrase/recombinase XerD